MRLTPTGEWILQRVRAEGVVVRASLGPARYPGGWNTPVGRALAALEAAGLIAREPTPQHRGRIQYRQGRNVLRADGAIVAREVSA